MVATAQVKTTHRALGAVIFMALLIVPVASAWTYVRIVRQAGESVAILEIVAGATVAALLGFLVALLATCFVAGCIRGLWALLTARRRK